MSAITRISTCLVLSILFQVMVSNTSAYVGVVLPGIRRHCGNLPTGLAHPWQQQPSTLTVALSSSSSSSSSVPSSGEFKQNEKDQSTAMNTAHVKGLMDNLSGLLDKYILSGSSQTREQVANVFKQISSTSLDKELIQQSCRMIKRAGVPGSWVTEADSNGANKNVPQPATEGPEVKSQSTTQTGLNVANNLSSGRSALSARTVGSNKPDFLNSVMNGKSLESMAEEHSGFNKAMKENNQVDESVQGTKNGDAAHRVSELIAQAGAGTSFEGETIGIGGLDDVLAQVKRRVWTPLAAPPRLLEELGIHPVRGLLLYGKPGCGKTLLARTLGKVLSPMRPITVVSGPEIMDKYVGSSEKNLREVFDSPPDIYDKYKVAEVDGGEAIGKAALHVVVMDEFDAVGRTRGGRGGKGEQGDAGVARDSVVNQLLAKMDGVHPLPVPTLVIGLTNKRSLIEPALLRPGRFEVQVEVPPPRSREQRISILKVHTQSMHKAGRLLVADPPVGSAAERYLQKHHLSALSPYNTLLDDIAQQCEGFSGAALAGVARAAASHALERAVNEFSEQIQLSTERPSIMDCLVTQDDIFAAIEDVKNSMGTSDHSEESLESMEQTNETAPVESTVNEE